MEYAAWNSVIIGIEYDYVKLSLNSGGSCPVSTSGWTIAEPGSGYTTAPTLVAVGLSLIHI